MILQASNVKKRVFLTIISIFLLTACDGGDTSTPTAAILQKESPTPESQQTSITPSPTTYPTTDPEIPLAASVNGEVITLAEYQSELARAQDASDTGLRNYSEQEVLVYLIDEVLLAQGAVEAGFIADENEIQTRLDQLDMDEQALQDWLVMNDYTEDSFEHAFKRAISAAWMRDQIVSQVPPIAEQVHARQILIYNLDEAENVYAQLQSGTDFATLAVQYDPIASGDLGWFPRGYLTVPELDEPVFSLQPGEYTQIIETILGYHIVQVNERDPEHPLSPGALQTLQVRAVENWLLERRNQSDIQIFLS